jgi:hypothetical protein
MNEGLFQGKSMNFSNEGLFPDLPHPPAMPKGDKAHVGIPGEGPAGARCGTCRHAVVPWSNSKRYYRCNLNKARWSNGEATDIHLKDQACPKWEPEQSP